MEPKTFIDLIIEYRDARAAYDAQPNTGGDAAKALVAAADAIKAHRDDNDPLQPFVDAWEAAVREYRENFQMEDAYAECEAVTNAMIAAAERRLLIDALVERWYGNIKDAEAAMIIAITEATKD